MKTFAPNIDLTSFLNREGRRYLVPSQRRLVSTRQGVRLDNAPHNAPAYAVTKEHGDWWLVNTGELYKKGFLFQARKRGIRLYANPAKHSGRRKEFSGFEVKTYKAINPPSYEDLIRWHTEEYSGLYAGLPVGSRFPERFWKEVMRQYKPQLARAFSRRWPVIIGKK